VLNGHKYQSKMGELILGTQCSGDKIKVLTELKAPGKQSESQVDFLHGISDGK
jgi:hypothetical protein